MSQRGQSTVEFVLVLPFFLLGLFMVMGLVAGIVNHQWTTYKAYMQQRQAMVETQ